MLVSYWTWGPSWSGWYTQCRSIGENWFFFSLPTYINDSSVVNFTLLARFSFIHPFLKHNKTKYKKIKQKTITPKLDKTRQPKKKPKMAGDVADAQSSIPSSGRDIGWGPTLAKPNPTNIVKLVSLLNSHVHLSLPLSDWLLPLTSFTFLPFSIYCHQWENPQRSQPSLL